MRITIRYSPPNALDLSGNASELYKLNQKIKKFLSSSQKHKIWQLKPIGNPFPYKKILSTLSIELSASKGMIEVEKEQLLLSGNKYFLCNFADNLPYDAEAHRYHVHYDLISFGDILSEQSLDIVLNKNDRDD